MVSWRWTLNTFWQCCGLSGYRPKRCRKKTSVATVVFFVVLTAVKCVYEIVIRIYG